MDQGSCVILSPIDLLPGHDNDDDDDDYDPSATASGLGGAGKLFERLEPSQGLLNMVAAVKYAGAASSQEQIRDAPVMGFVYVAEVDETRKRIRFLAPHPGRWGDKVLVIGNWPESVGDLVT